MYRGYGSQGYGSGGYGSGYDEVPEYNMRGDSANGYSGALSAESIMNAAMQSRATKSSGNPFHDMLAQAMPVAPRRRAGTAPPAEGPTYSWPSPTTDYQPLPGNDGGYDGSGINPGGTFYPPSGGRSMLVPEGLFPVDMAPLTEPSTRVEVPAGFLPVDTMTLPAPTVSTAPRTAGRRRGATGVVSNPNVPNLVPDVVPTPVAAAPPPVETPIGHYSPEEIARLQPRGAGPLQTPLPAGYSDSIPGASAPAGPVVQTPAGPVAVTPSGAVVPAATAATVPATGAGVTADPSQQNYLDSLQKSLMAYNARQREEAMREFRSESAMTNMQDSGAFTGAMGDLIRDMYLAQGREGAQAMFTGSENAAERALKGHLAGIESGDRRWLGQLGSDDSRYLGQMNDATRRIGDQLQASSQISAASLGAGANRYGAELGYKGQMAGYEQRDREDRRQNELGWGNLGWQREQGYMQNDLGWGGVNAGVYQAELDDRYRMMRMPWEIGPEQYTNQAFNPYSPNPMYQRWR